MSAAPLTRYAVQADAKDGPVRFFLEASSMAGAVAHAAELLREFAPWTLTWIMNLDAGDLPGDERYRKALEAFLLQADPHQSRRRRDRKEVIAASNAGSLTLETVVAFGWLALDDEGIEIDLIDHKDASSLPRIHGPRSS